MALNAEGELTSQQLGLRLGVRDGLYLASKGRWLRWLDAEGRVLPTAEEQARAAEERSQALAEKLAAYEKRFGPLT